MNVLSVLMKKIQDSAVCNHNKRKGNHGAKANRLLDAGQHSAAKPSSEKKQSSGTPNANAQAGNARLSCVFFIRVRRLVTPKRRQSASVSQRIANHNQHRALDA
jgi:hypothetical protein